MLELLHPDGSVTTSFVLGSNCPEDLFPESPKVADQEIDLIVLAPTPEECRSEDWLEDAAKSVNHRLAADGVCYMLLPPPWRLKMIESLSRFNLRVDSSYWHFPGWTSSHYLVPLLQGPARFAARSIISTPTWKRILARAIFRFPAAHKMLSIFWRSIGICVRRPGARPLFQWLFNSEHKGTLHGTAIIRRSWRGLQGTDVLYRFAQGDELPSAIVKSACIENSLAWLDREAEVLDVLGPGARSSGVQVPHVLLTAKNEQRSLLFLSAVQGKPASDLLASNPDLLFPIVTKIVDWLERWHGATASVRSLNEQSLEHDFFVPMQRLAPFLQNAEAYQDWLAARLRTALGTPSPFVATHNDLTMANILLDDHDRLGVVDWETGLAESWPLVDFYYAVTDAVRIAEGYNNWLEAFQACYQPNGKYSEQVRCWESQLRSTIGMSSGLAELCFHACWLHHASNEQAVSRTGDARPFLDIIQWLVLNYAKVTSN